MKIFQLWWSQVMTVSKMMIPLIFRLTPKGLRLAATQHMIWAPFRTDHQSQPPAFIWQTLQSLPDVSSAAFAETNVRAGR